MPNLAAITRSASAVVDDAIALATRFFGSNPGAMAGVARRLGLGSLASPSAVIRSMKESPVTTALVLFELGEAGSALLSELSGVSEEARKIVEGMTFDADEPPSEDIPLSEISAYRDELQMIKQVQRKLGLSTGDLILLKNVLSLDMRFFQLYVKVKEMGI